uniref:BTB domain-containing protein n=1 Tax=Trichuris muris TaxID=70415 RepID=A0A5S6R5H0_TRIMR
MPITLDDTIQFALSGDQLEQSSRTTVRTTKESLCGYEWYVECRTSEQDGQKEFLLLAVPCDDCGDFELLVDYELTVSIDDVQAKLVVDRELINCRYGSMDYCPMVLRVAVGPASADRTTSGCSLLARIIVHELLTVKRDDLTVETEQDGFIFSAATKMFYVDLRYLAGLGPGKFADLFERAKRGLRRMVVLSASPEELDVFLTALCRYGRPVITGRNWFTVFCLARDFRADSVIRLCEAFLINAKAIHIVRKLEYAIQYNMRHLDAFVVREVQRDGQNALELLYQYLETNGEELSQMHPRVLRTFGVFDEYVLL